MKGFVYLLEIAIAAILIVVVLGAFFSIRVKQDWESSDLIGVGNNMLNYIRQKDDAFVKILDENFTELEKNRIPNTEYGLVVRGSPKSNIVVGCVQQCSYLEGLLTPTFVNGRWIIFTVVDSLDMADIPNNTDAIVLIGYTGYTAQKQNILNYLAGGGAVIGINATYNNNNNDFNDIFGLNDTSPASNPSHFVAYDPSIEDVQKYFMGVGFNMDTEWYIWGDRWTVNYGSNYINVSRGGTHIDFLEEGDVFDMPGPGSVYSFRIKEIWFGSQEANIQPTSTDFIFEDFSETNDVRGNQNILSMPGGQAVMASNGNAVWMSDFPSSSEYESLLKAAILSKTDDWTAISTYTTKETVTVSSFFNLCCDMPEIAELEITLWYVV